MRLRKEQVDAMKGPDHRFRRELASLLAPAGGRADIDPDTGDLVIFQPSQPQTRVRFDDRGTPRELHGQDGRTLKFEYAPDGRAVSLVDRVGHRSTMTFDRQSRCNGVVNPLGDRRELVYENDRLVAVRRERRPEMRLVHAEKPIPSITLFDGRNRPFRIEGDAEQRQFRVTDRNGGVTQFGIDVEDRPTHLVLPHRAEWKFEYDPEGQTTRLIYPDGKFESLRFEDGRQAESVGRDGRVTHMAHDGEGRLTEIAYPDGPTVTLEYDDQGNLLAVDNGTHPIKFEYDGRGRCVAQEMGGRRIKARYGPEGLIGELSNHRDETISFTHGADQRVERIQDWDGQTYVLQHDAAGYLAHVAFPHEIRWTRRSLPGGQPEREELWQGRQHLTRQYVYDANDLVSEVHDSGYGVKAFQYDAEDRLTAVKGPGKEFQRQYDGNGNPLLSGGRRYSYDKLDQLVEIRDKGRCVHDPAGNLTELHEDGKTTVYHYNGQNQLVLAELPDGRQVEYEYDGIGRRMLKRVGEVTTHYTWWGWNLIAEDIEGPQPQRIDYLYVPGSLQPLSMRLGKHTYYYQCDHLLTPVRLLDRTGAVVWQAESLGFDFHVVTARVPQPLRFPGQYWDSETGLHYNGARYYHPTLGRYLSPDPEGFRDRFNRYQYAANCPTLFVDPTGRLGPLAAAALFVAGAVVVGAAFGAVFGAVHQGVSNAVQGRPITQGMGDAALSGAGNGAVGGLGFGVGALLGGPVGAIAGAILAPALMQGAIAAANAPEGEGWEACVDATVNALPIVGSIKRYQEGYGPSVTNPEGQLAVDLVFDVIGIGLLFLGGRAIRGRTGGWTTPYRPGATPRATAPPETSEPPVVAEPEGPPIVPEQPPAEPAPPQEPARPTAAERLAAKREALRQQRLQEATDDAIAKGKLKDLSPADRQWIQEDSTGRRARLAYDPDTGSFKPNEARAALSAEQEGQLPGPVERAFDQSGRSGGGDVVDGAGKVWDVKDASAGAEQIAEVAAPRGGQPGENVLVDASKLTPAERQALQNDINARKAPGSADIVITPRP